MKFKSISMAVIFILTIAFPANVSFAQIESERADDVFRELESEKLTLRFFNAVNGEPIPDAKVEIENVGEYQSDFEGKVLFAAPEEDGQYKVTVEKKGFIRSVFSIDIQVGSLIFNRFSISPGLPPGAIRIALDWSKKPRDLDAHLVKMGSFHISYRNKKVSQDGVARLDRDDTDGFGPETITANRIDDNAVYHYFIHNYSNRKKSSDKNLSNSKASVKFFGGSNELLGVFQVASNNEGTYWHVLSIIKGQIVPVNKISNSKPDSFR